MINLFRQSLIYRPKKNEANIEPLIAIVSPSGSETIHRGDTIIVKVQTNDPDGLVDEVNFSINGTQVFSSTLPPYDFTWLTGTSDSGAVTVAATVVDNEGASATTSMIFSINEIQASLMTLPITNIGPISATTGGSISIETDLSLSEIGVCWSSNENPTINDFSSKTSSYTQTNDMEYETILTGLDLNSLYYAKAYAIIGDVTIYGEEFSFTTASEYYSDQGSFIDARDGAQYNWSKIGEQTWMAENLKYGANLSYSAHMAFVYGYSGEYDFIGNVDDYDFEYARTLDNYDTYGFIYDLDELNPSCPDGWHIPTDVEWNQLINYLGGKENAAKHLKSDNADFWNGPNEATNKSKFSILPGGAISIGPNGGYSSYGLGTSTRFWGINTLNTGSFGSTVLVSITNDSDKIIVNDFIRYTDTGYCRCLKDE